MSIQSHIVGSESHNICMSSMLSAKRTLRWSVNHPTPWYCLTAVIWGMLSNI